MICRFLLAQLQIGSLVTKHTRRDVRRALDTLGENLDKTYDEIMSRILTQDQDSVDLAIRILSWLTYTKTPLRVIDLQHALSIDGDSIQIDEEALPEAVSLVSVCAGLVTIERYSNRISWVHHTIQEYFERIGERALTGAKYMMATVCFKYIFLVEAISVRGAKYVDLIEEYPFLTYTAQYWKVHMQEATCIEGCLTELENYPRLEEFAARILQEVFRLDNFNQGILWHGREVLTRGRLYFHDRLRLGKSVTRYHQSQSDAY